MNEASGEHEAIESMKYFNAVGRGIWGADITLDQYISGYARRAILIFELQIFMESYPVLLLPVSAEQAFPQDLDISNMADMLRSASANWSMMGGNPRFSGYISADGDSKWTAYRRTTHWTSVYEERTT